MCCFVELGKIVTQVPCMFPVQAILYTVMDLCGYAVFAQVYRYRALANTVFCITYCMK